MIRNSVRSSQHPGVVACSGDLSGKSTLPMRIRATPSGVIAGGTLRRARTAASDAGKLGRAAPARSGLDRSDRAALSVEKERGAALDQVQRTSGAHDGGKAQ